MESSIPIPSPNIADTHSSHASLKRPSTQKACNSKPPTKRRKKANGRFDSANEFGDFEEEGDDAYNNRLSAKTRDTVLKLKRIKDPFDPDLQEVVDDVFVHIDQQSCDNVDLAESALLLSSVTHVYSTQVRTLHDEVLAMAARLTGRESPPKGRKKKRFEDLKEIGVVSEDKQGTETGDKEKTSNDITGDADNDKEKDSSVVNDAIADANETTNPVEGENSADNNNLPNGDITDNNNEDNNAQPGEAKEGENVNLQSKNGGAENTEPTEPTVEDLQKLESEILNEIPARCTRRQSERLKNILNIEKAQERDYKLKKRKFDEDPPTLISCHDEWNEILPMIEARGDVDDDDTPAPELEVQVGRKRRKVAINNNNEISGDNDDNNNCEACHQAGNEGGADTEKVEETSPFKLPLPVGQYETLDHLPNDVQESFHALVQEMHKLPFDYGLMQNDMFKMYQQKFLQAVSLLSQNSVLVKRTERDEEVDKVVDLNDSQMSESDQTISTIAELLSQVRQQAAEDYHKGKQSKSDAEIPVSQMIATLKRIICSRYKKWHVRTDSDKAVFKRIKEFEDKVKAVLKKEAEQGLFDVKKYEMEVMDVTIKESQENETDEFGCPMSPIPCPIAEGAESPRPEELRDWRLSCSSRRSSIAGSIDGSNGWIRLVDIFSHMKKIDNSETCRHFYAILALLSHQNLSINYDTLFSQESAKLITKLLKKQNGSMEKYPVGAKIMTSRCPDVDRDEVLLAPVFTAAFRQALEQDGYLSSSGYQSDSQASSNASISFAQSKTLQEAISEFVVDPGEPCTEDLFSTRRRKNQ